MIRHFGWLEDEFKADRTSIRWVLSLGSNRALEYLNSGAVDFGSAAGLASVLARANGNPIHTVYVFSRPEWTALVVRKDSPIRSLADLKGKKIAATRGTDPFLFTLRALHGRPDPRRRRNRQPAASGRAHRACERPGRCVGRPRSAHGRGALDDGARLLYRNVTFNTYGFLNVRDAFASQYPQAVTRVLKVYDRARQWIVAHPADTAQIVADESKVSLPVAKAAAAQRLQRSRSGRHPARGAEGGRPVLTAEQLTKPGVDPAKIVDTLIDPSFARPLVDASR